MPVNPERTHYAVLDVVESATIGGIKAAFREKAKVHHPDRGGDAALFAAMTEAQNVLTNEAKRREYDRELAAARRSEPKRPVYDEPPPWPAGRTDAPYSPRPPWPAGRSEAPYSPARPASPVPQPAPARPAAAQDLDTGRAPNQHTARLWAPMAVAAGLSFAVVWWTQKSLGGSHPSDVYGGGAGWGVEALLGGLVGAGALLLLGGHLLERRNHLARADTGTVARVIGAVTAVATLRGAVWPILPGWMGHYTPVLLHEWFLPFLHLLVFLAVLAAGVLAREGVRARDWRTVHLHRLALETLQELWHLLLAVLGDVWSVTRDVAWGMTRFALRLVARGSDT